jgi:hypothetical protein
MAVIDDVRLAFGRLWREGNDGKDLAMAFVRVGAETVRDERPEELTELRRLIDEVEAALPAGTVPYGSWVESK